MLKQKAEEKISEEEFKPIRKRIVDLVESMGEYDKNPGRKDSLAAKALNDLLEKLGIPYRLNRKNYIWTINPLVDEQ